VACCGNVTTTGTRDEMVSTPLHDLRDRFAKAVIVGSGPTSFDFTDFENIHDPVIFINQMHTFSSICPSRNQYFVTHHITQYPQVRPVTIFLERFFIETGDYDGVLVAKLRPKGRYIAVDAQCEDEVITDAFARKHSWMFDRDKVVQKNRLMALFGSVTTALHLAWLMGVKDVDMIGCNPDSPSNRHDRRIEGRMVHSPEKVKQNTRLVPAFLQLAVTHI
jgi:hypothetical protein